MANSHAAISVVYEIYLRLFYKNLPVVLYEYSIWITCSS
jgi:hypothetical protein